MKSKFLFSLLGSIGIIILISVSFILLNQNSKLQKLVDKQNNILNNYSNVDSLLDKGQIDLVDAINNFFDEVPTYKDGQQVSAIDFVNYHNRILDSLNLYKEIIEHSNKRYGTNVDKVWLNDSTYYIGSKFYSRADSAQLTYEYFKDKISKNNNGGWTIRTGTYEEQYDKLFIDYKNLLEKYNSLADNHIQLSKDYNKQLEKHNELLNAFEKEGLIKLDTIENGVRTITY